MASDFVLSISHVFHLIHTLWKNLWIGRGVTARDTKSLHKNWEWENHNCIKALKKGKRRKSNFFSKYNPISFNFISCSLFYSFICFSIINVGALCMSIWFFASPFLFTISDKLHCCCFFDIVSIGASIECIFFCFCIKMIAFILRTFTKWNFWWYKKKQASSNRKKDCMSKKMCVQIDYLIDISKSHDKKKR